MLNVQDVSPDVDAECAASGCGCYTCTCNGNVLVCYRCASAARCVSVQNTLTKRVEIREIPVKMIVADPQVPECLHATQRRRYRAGDLIAGEGEVVQQRQVTCVWARESMQRHIAYAVNKVCVFESECAMDALRSVHLASPLIHTHPHAAYRWRVVTCPKCCSRRL